MTTGRKKWRIGLYYIFIITLSMIAVMVLAVGVVALLNKVGIIEGGETGSTIALITIAAVSVFLTAIIVLIIGTNIIEPVTRLSDISMKVARGDFNATLDAHSAIEELQNVIDSFNAMVKELASNETLSTDFISNVSHELKTPIAAIEGYATLLQDETQTEEERRECVDKILFNTNRLSQLTGNILLLSRLETQNIISDKRWFSLDEQIRQAVLTLEKSWSDKNISFDIDMAEVLFFGSEALLPVAWTNIIGNAIKYSPKDSIISITLEETAGFAIVTVSDKGVGMSAETKDRMFDKFYQGDKSHRSEGNGLGLTMVKRILDLCNGRVVVESEVGKGTEFTVYLPSAGKNSKK